MSLEQNDKEGQQDVTKFLASPRHSYWFLTNEDARLEILNRVQSMIENNGTVVREEGQGIIINFDNDFVEVHDGNKSVVAWVLYRRLLNETTLWKDLRPNCDPPPKEILHHRVTRNNDVWHPYVPIEVVCADLLGKVRDHRGKLACKALTLDNYTPVYFNDLKYFHDDDVSETIGQVAKKLEQLEDFRQHLYAFI